MPKLESQRGIAHIALVIVGLIVVSLIVISFVSGAAKLNLSVTKNSDKEDVAVTKDSPPLDRSNVEGEKYENSDYNISLYYPDDFELREGSGSDYVVSLLSPKEYTEDTFRENVLVSVADMSQYEGITLLQVMDAWIQQTSLDTSFIGFEVISREKATMDGYNAEQIVYIADREGLKVKGSTIITLVDTDAYVFMYTAAASSYDTFYRDLIGVLSNTQFIF